MRDRPHLERLRTHLKPLERDGQLVLFDESSISAGSLIEQAIAQAIERAQVGVLLITADFLAEDALMIEQLPQLLSRQQRGEITLLPVLVSPCDYRASRLDMFQPVNQHGCTLSQLSGPDQEQFFKRLVQLVLFGADQLSEQTSAQSGVSTQAGPALSSLRGSSLGIQKQLDLLTHAKTAHDALHRIQFHVYGPISAEEPSFPDGSDDERLESASDELEKVITKLRDDGSTLPVLGEIVTELRATSDILLAALRQRDPRALRKTISSIRRVLQRYPTRVNGEIVSAVESLSLERLRAHAPALLPALAESVTELSLLGADLHFLNARHCAWQAVEEDLLLAEAAFSKQEPDTEDVEDLYYPKSKECFDALCSEYEKAPAALMLDAGCLHEVLARSASVEQAFRQKNVQGIRKSFTAYRRAMGKCFYKADDMLLKHCGYLQRAALRLREVLEQALGGRIEQIDV